MSTSPKPKKKRRQVKPDEEFHFGHGSIARFGKNLVWQSNADEKSHNAMLESAKKRLPEVIAEINELISNIVELVSSNKPEELLKRAWWESAAKHLMIDVEAEVGSEEITAQRMIDYVQSIIAAVPAAKKIKDQVSEEDWEQLHLKIEELFFKLNLDFAICNTAKETLDNPDYDFEYEEFQYKARSLWCNVRGKRFYYHQITALQDLIADQSEQIEAVYGISAETLISELKKIWHNQIFGLGEAMEDLSKFREETETRILELRSQDKHSKKTAKELMKLVQEDEKFTAKGSSIFGKALHLDLFDLQKTTNLPVAFLNDFSWKQGEEKNFFSVGDYSGWPTNVWPIFKRPFVYIDERYLCFDLHAVFDNIYRQLEKKIFEHSKEVKQSWIDQRKVISEDLPAKYLLKLLEGATDFGEVYYRFPTGAKQVLNWCETDRLISFDDKLFVIEVKSGAFTWTSPATDVDAYLQSIKALVEAPSLQGDRFVDYFKGAEEVVIFDSEHNEIERLRCGDYSRVFKLAVTIDPFTELSAQSQYLRKIGINTGKYPLWSLSIDDLRVFSDIFDTPIEFIHFAEKRIDAFQSDLVRLNDELDHLGLYLEHNNYVMYANEMVGPDTKLDFIGYRSAIDRKFTEELAGKSSNPLSQDMHPRLKELVSYLSEVPKIGRTQLAGYMLDMDGEWRDETFNLVEEELSRVLSGEALRPLSTIGDVRVTLNVWSDAKKPKVSLENIQHVKAQMVMNDEQDRLLLQLGYSEKRALIDVNWRMIHASEISFLEKPSLQKRATEIQGKRILKAKALAKIGRNEKCPCGSGKKFKKCCLIR